jgi:hypothetical protein
MWYKILRDHAEPKRVTHVYVNAYLFFQNHATPADDNTNFFVDYAFSKIRVLTEFEVDHMFGVDLINEKIKGDYLCWINGNLK